VQFYRVYRDGTAIANRYDVTGTTSYVDAPGGSHSYWVTAVDDNFRESPATGPVSP
jgi:hypothetical protein